jgi:phenylalanyl-tRNA synthetase beta chain
VRVPLSWLRDYVDFDLPAERLAERLTLLGLEVQSVDQIGDEWSSVVVGELLDVQRHPNADRLSLTQVRIGDTDQPLSIVCGATNIAVGQRVPVALPGAVLPGDRRIGLSTIQGTQSQGMLCSGAELGLTTDADGILILPADTRIGALLTDIVGDTVLDIDVKPNRGDALSLIGLAREVAAITGSQVRWPEIVVPEAGDATDEHVWVEVADKRLCPRFVARWVDGVRVAASPFKVQLRLGAAGMRPVSNVVDASNYVMLEMGKPIHTFDAGAVSGGQIIVRAARDGEMLVTLDHVERTLSSDTLVIADSRGPIGIAGVMGGAGSEVSDATTAVIVESAVFDPVSIRRTAFRYALRSEASLRFEKGQELRLARVGADRTAQLLAEWAGGRVATGVVDTNPVDEQPLRVTYRPSRVNRLLGSALSSAEMESTLARIGIASDKGTGDDDLVAVVPPHRRDITIEPDIAEEVIRLVGYDALPGKLPDTRMPGYRPEPRRLPDVIRDALAGRGFNEVVTNALIAPGDHAALGYDAADPGTIRIENPVSVDHSEMRRSMLPGLLGVLVRNERQRRRDVAAFEIGALHEWREGRPEQAEVLAVMIAGNWRSQSWAEAARESSFEDLKGVVEALAARLHVGRIGYAAVEPRRAVEHPGRTAEIVAHEHAERAIGRVFEIDPRLLARYDVRSERVAFALLDLDAISKLAPIDTAPQVRETHTLPVVERDIAVELNRDTKAADVEAAIREAAGPLLVRTELFDRYQGPQLESGKISLAYRLEFQPVDQPLSDASLDETIGNVVRSLESRVGGRIRSGG